jgi:hypothetical protein
MSMSSSSRGFGTTNKSPNSDANELLIKPTRPQEHRIVGGQFAKILARMSSKFEELKPKYGVSKDVYARLSTSDVFWFVGKVSHADSITADEALSSLSIMIQEYSKSLRPIELAKLRLGGTELQIWTAPGNTEMDVAKNVISLEMLQPVDVSLKLPNIFDSIGFEPEIYVNGEEGFRCKRNADGTPVKPQFDVNIKPPMSI